MSKSLHIENCKFDNNIPPVNEHTRAAIEALARAVEANANAIIGIAKALAGPDANQVGLKIIQGED